MRAAEPIDLKIDGGFVFDTELGVFRPNTGIGVNDGRFVAAADATESLTLTDDQYILPGFIDCHAHYNVRLIKRRREEFAYMPVLYLASGATVTFSAGEFDPGGMVRLREKIETGEQIGPRLITSGPYFGRARPGWDAKRPEEQLRKEIRYWVKQGAGGFKAKSIDPESLRILIDEAHKHGITVTGHLDSGYRNSVNPRDAISMGIDRIEHFLGGDAMPNSQSAYRSLQNIRADTPQFKEICQHFVRNGVFFDCTLTAYGYLGRTAETNLEEYQYWIDERQFFTEYMQRVAKERKPASGMEIYQRIYQAKQQTIRAFYEAGGMITLGTDHVSDGNHVAGFGIHREIDALVRNGIPERDAIRIATINGAKALKIDADHGSITLGKFADCVIVRCNPLENIRNTRNVLKVIRAGEVYDAAELLDSVRGKIGPTSKEDESNW
ncbi:MAG: amidohydrolase family protein [Aureliella sp.]